MPEQPCPNLKTNLEGCPCTSEDCPRRGTCCECVRNHVASGSLPACCREIAKALSE